jgi:hypothetical protein
MDYQRRVGSGDSPACRCTPGISHSTRNAERSIDPENPRIDIAAIGDEQCFYIYEYENYPSGMALIDELSFTTRWSSAGMRVPNGSTDRTLSTMNGWTSGTRRRASITLLSVSYAETTFGKSTKTSIYQNK